MNPVVSVITVSFNAESFIANCLRSVSNQNYGAIEHVVIDGNSSDRTLEIVRAFGTGIILKSEPDSGIYDAMNKGVALATGDIICFLNSDDVFSDDFVIRDIANFYTNTRFDVCAAGIRMVNVGGRVVRNWDTASARLKPAIFQPQLPHPGMFYSGKILREMDPCYDSSFKICGDLDLQIRLLSNPQLKVATLDRYVVNMSMGGASTASLGAYIQGWMEAWRAWNKTYRIGGGVFVAQKVFRKLWQISR